MSEYLLMLLLVLNVLILIEALAIYCYLRQIFRLTTVLKERQPELWRKLGSPEQGYMDQTDIDGFRRMYYISPFMPFFKWLLTGQFHWLDRETRLLATSTRRLFYIGLYLFVLILALFIPLMMHGSSQAR